MDGEEGRTGPRRRRRILKEKKHPAEGKEKTKRACLMEKKSGGEEKAATKPSERTRVHGEARTEESVHGEARTEGSNQTVRTLLTTVHHCSATVRR